MSRRRSLPLFVLALLVLALTALAPVSPRAVSAQQAYVRTPAAALPAPRVARDPLPFGPGEHLVYKVAASKMGASGRGELWVEDAPAEVRGAETLVLHFDMKAGVGPIKASARSTSWLDPSRMAARRFAKRESRPFSTHDEAFELFPDERRWTDAAGTSGESPTDEPLDELSFLYFVRLLPLTPETTYEFNRHFEAARNPVTVSILGHEPVATALGTFATTRVEMRVVDPRHYKGVGVVRINLSDDDCRIPVRIESAMPDGTVILTLESHTGGA